MRHLVCRQRSALGLWLVASVGFGLGAGCSSGGEGEPGPTGTIALALSPGSATAVQGGSTQVVATLTRAGGITAEVTLSVEGAPSGVTGVVSNIVTLGTTTTAIVTISVSEAVAPSGYNLTVRARGSGVSDVTAVLALSVTALPSFVLSLGPVSLVIDRGANDVVQVVIDRTNYAGGIALSFEGAPLGVTGSFAPATPTGTSSTLNLAVGAMVATGQYVLIVRGSGAGAGSLDRTASLTLTVTLAPNRIDAGSGHTVAIKPDGTIWTWGENSYGQLGDGTLINRLIPTPTGTGTTWRALAVGVIHTVAISSDRTLWAWGSNASGQLGDGTTADRSAPTKIGTVTTWRAIAAGIQHTVALRSDGTLWAWGSNRFGQLGDGTTTDRPAPTQIGTSTTWSVIAVGDMFTLALKSDGTLWAWGDNRDGQLGDGTIINRETPTPIAGGATWTAIAGGTAFTLALKSDGTLWAWGNNGSGQLGDGPTMDRLTPTQIGTGTTWSSVAAGTFHAIARKSDGTLWTWGSNSFGELGSGYANSFRPTPEQIGTATTWTAIAGGSHHSIAMQSDGSLWTWGFNGGGQLGDGTTTSRSIPALIGF